ncbi:lipopolysaccharide biosynthesis protein [Puia dinghuensis]|uniref:Polysaccharide biosynthesis protein n=1 Tax=Puia dinghuensis TaxID=1792502 RepID=A0A8J2UGD5_9BACT|nr:polysaccharide biosynthesis C-terminal domain-containing protein [Puia dinghuensis]GGB14169.1 polysaccharide biosynthesis protein [Puia dinghuensis]
MSSIKKLAGETVWYGISSIAAKFIVQLLTPYLTAKFRGTPEFGHMSVVYAAISFINIGVLFGLDYAYFRYINKKDIQTTGLYPTLLISLVSSTTLITTLIILFRGPIAGVLDIANHPGYITLSALLIAFDALSALPFARLRHEGRPRKYAFIRLSGIVFYVALIFFFLSVCPRLLKSHPNSIIGFIYQPKFGYVGYVLLANVLQNAFQLVLLSPLLKGVHWTFNVPLWRHIMVYSLPLTVAGFGGMINETFDRIMLEWRLPHANSYSTYQAGIYSGCYKLSLLITVFVQAFRMAAEPFFFRQSVEESAQRTYARVMKFFVILVSGMFLFVMMYIDIWKLFIQDPSMYVGLKVVPILLFANMFLGIYYNLSIWYKLLTRTQAGAYITLIGAAITLVVNYVFIPRYGYMASAWATFLCYGSMMVISYVWGQKVYPVPYAWRKLTAYMVIVAVIYFAYLGLTSLWSSRAFAYTLGTMLLGAYVLFILRVERKEFSRLPVIGKYLGGAAAA